MKYLIQQYVPLVYAKVSARLSVSTVAMISIPFDSREGVINYYNSFCVL